MKLFLHLTLLFTFLKVLFTNGVSAQIALEKDSLIVDAPDFQELRIDPAFASVVGEEELFDSVSYVFLETTRASEFSTISQLEVTDKHYIILDSRLQVICFFYKDGRFDKKISAPKDFKHTRGFTINPSAQRLIVNDRSHFNYMFDLDGNPVEKIKKTVYASDYTYLDDFKLQYNGFHIVTDVGDAPITNYPNVVVINEKDSSRQEYLWFNPLDSLAYDIFSHRSFYRSGSETGIFFARGLDNIMYRFDRTGRLQRQFKIILPLQHSLPLDFWTSPIYKGKRLDFLSQNIDVSNNISDVYQIGDWLTFSAFDFKPIFYHLLSGEYFDFSQMQSNNMGLKITSISKDIVGVDENAFITTLSHMLLKRLYDTLSSDERKNVREEFKKAITQSYHNPILKLLYVKEP